MADSRSRIHIAARLAAAASMACAAAAQSEPAEPTLAEVVARVRQATGWEHWRRHATGLQADGQGHWLGNAVPCSLLVDGDGRFLQRFDGPLPMALGWNGEQAWQLELAGQPRVLDLGERSELIIKGAALSGAWLAEKSPLALRVDGERSDETALVLAFEYTPGHERGTIEIDRDTWLPRKWTIQSGGATQTLVFDGRIEFEGLLLPESIREQAAGGTNTAVTFERVSAAPTFVRSPFDPPPLRTDEVVFDASIPGQLEIERAPTGHLLVRPLLNGRPAGWFIFDTGAGASVISTPDADELDLAAVATVTAVGVGGAVNAPIYKMESVSVGPVTLRNPVLIDIDLTFLTGPLGRPIAGVIGYDLISSCVAEIDLAAGRVVLHPPGSTPAGDLTWSPLRLADRVPCVEARFEGHRGLIRFDTGSNSGIQFHAPAVERLKLLEGRVTTDAQTGGVGGTIPMKQGTLAYLELGGQKLEQVSANFAQRGDAAHGDAYTDAVVGGAILKKYVMYLDYAGRRAALRPRPD